MRSGTPRLPIVNCDWARTIVGGVSESCFFKEEKISSLNRSSAWPRIDFAPLILSSRYASERQGTALWFLEDKKQAGCEGSLWGTRPDPRSGYSRIASRGPAVRWSALQSGLPLWVARSAIADARLVMVIVSDAGSSCAVIMIPLWREVNSLNRPTSAVNNWSGCICIATCVH